MSEETAKMLGVADSKWAGTLLGAWGFYQLLAGLYFIVFRPSFLPEDLRASATTLEAVRGAAPGIEAWLQWVFAVLGGQMAACGTVIMGAAFSIARGRRPEELELGAYAIAGLVSVVMMSVVNFALASDFRWLLVAPVMLWLVALIAVGRRAFGKVTR